MIWSVRFRRGLGFGALLLLLIFLLVPAILPLLPSSILLSLRDDAGLGLLINRLADVGRISLLMWIVAWVVTVAFRLKNRGQRDE